MGRVSRQQSRGLGPIARAGHLQNGLNMLFHRSDRDHQFASDHLVALPVLQRMKHFKLSTREVRGHVDAVRAARMPMEGRLLREIGPASRNQTNGGGDQIRTAGGRNIAVDA